MDPALRDALTAQDGVASVAALVALGVSRSTINAHVRTGALVRIRRDSLVDGGRWRSAAPWERHALRARAVSHSARTLGLPVALSHHSALAVQGHRLYGVDDRVHLVRLDAQRGRSEARLHIHPPLTAEWVADVDGHACVLPGAAALQVTGASGVEAGLVSLDSVLASAAADLPTLERMVRTLSFNHGTPKVRTALAHASALSESAGETRLRWAFVLGGLPRPEEQAVLRDRHGALVGRVDFLFREQRVVVEFDGRTKYQASEVVWEEKRREDRLRELGYQVLRITWAELADPHAVCRRVRAALERARLAA